jgi:hypothetical protein
MRRVVCLALVATAFAAFYIARNAGHVVVRTDQATERPYVRLYDHPARGLQSALATGDGQAFGAIAQDPTMARPEVFRAGPDDAAYRWQRPLLGYLSYVASFGRARWEPRAQAVVVAIGVGLAIAALALLLMARSVHPALALLVLLTPGLLASMSGLTAEAWALALLTFGLIAWQAPRRRPWIAAAVLTLATLTRESVLVAVVALIVVEVYATVANGAPRLLSRIAPLGVPILAFAAWATLERVRLGAWPFSAREGRLALVPFSGLVHDVGEFTHPLQSVLWLVVAGLFVVYAIVRGRRDPLTPIVVAYAIFACFIGDKVWGNWEDFGRVLEPIYAYGLVVFLTALSSSSRRAELDVALDPTH